MGQDHHHLLPARRDRAARLPVLRRSLLTTYTTVHLGIAAFCSFLAVVHLALWRLGRDPVHGWIVMVFVGLIVNALSLAGGSAGASGSLGDARWWLLLGSVGSLPLALPGGIMMFRRVVAVPPTGWRRAWLGLVVLLAVANGIRALAFVLGNWTAPQAPTWEEMTRVGALSFLAPAAILATLVAVLVEGALAIRRGNRIGWLPFTVVPVMIGIAVIETLSKVAGDRAPALVGLQGLFFVLPASMVVVVRYARAMRVARQAGGYSLIRRLSAGGMGELWLASRVGAGGFERKVALKRVLHERGTIDEASIERLLAEARLSARLTHPNVIAVHDVGRLEADEHGAFGWFIAMEWLPGVNLAEVRDAAKAFDEQLPPGFVTHVGQQACLGLAHAHAHGVVHRDVSPQNVMVTFDGAVKVVDFGIAVAMAEREAGADAGYAVGKFPYMSPEMLSHGKGSPGSDLHGLGVMLYELLAGRRPFQGGTRVEIVESVLAGRFTPLRAIRPDVSEKLAAAVERALGGKNAGPRFTSAEEMEVALGEALSEMTVPRIGDLVRRICKFAWQEFEGKRASEPTKTRRSAADDVPTSQLPE